MMSANKALSGVERLEGDKTAQVRVTTTRQYAGFDGAVGLGDFQDLSLCGGKRHAAEKYFELLRT